MPDPDYIANFLRPDDYDDSPVRPKHHHHDHNGTTYHDFPNDHDHDGWHHHHGPSSVLHHKHNGPDHHVHDYDIRTTWNIDNDVHYGDYHDDDLGPADHSHPEGRD